MSQEFKNQGNEIKDYIICMRTELEKDLDFIAQELKDEELSGTLQNVLLNATDIILYISYPSREPVGFDIGLTTVRPKISLVYSRGGCKLWGSWGDATAEKYIDNEICETVLDYLEDLS